ncbi:MAG TPA: glycosyltransferase [Gammaproteobacteria bacterium]|nr:glycosyltransferase [Gammaproteobacteria bacterium]
MQGLSIITVVYNDLSALQDTYRSLCGQLDKDFEWVVVDGESSDGSAEFLKEVSNRGDLSKIVAQSEKDEGIYDAMNKGIRMASGSYALFLNAGDLLYSENTVGELKQACKAGVDDAGRPPVLFGDYVRLMPGGRELYSRAKDPGYIKRGMPTSHQAILYPMSFLKENPYDLQYRISSDYYITCKAYSLGFPLRRVDITIARFRTGGTASQNSRRVIQDMALIQQRVLRMPLWQIWLYAARRYINILAVRMLHQRRFGSTLLLKMINVHANFRRRM